MKRAASITVIVLLAMMIVTPLVIQGQDAAKEKKAEGVFAVLKPGQPCSLASVGTKWEITVFIKSPKVLGHTITNVSNEYIVIRDIADIKETRIPLYAIKSVNVVKIGGRLP